MMPELFRESARDHLENEILQTDDAQLLEATKVALQDDGGDERIGTLLAVKRLTILAEHHLLTHQKNLLLDPKSLKELGNVGQHSLALLTTGPGDVESLVLIEWLHYDARWGDEIVGKELRDRVESIAQRLNITDGHKIPCTLHCRGFFHDGTQNAFGLVYGIPLVPVGQNHKVITMTTHTVRS